MSTLLKIDSSPLYERSVSRQLTAAFTNKWTSAHPEGTVIDRDLNAAWNILRLGLQSLGLVP